MKKLIIPIVLLALSSSCAMMMNKKNVDVSISSNPPGADIFIESQYYGKTPTTINIEPRDYTAILNLEGYGTAQIKLESYQAVRRAEGEGGRCIADTLGMIFVVPAFSAFSVYCRDFKQGEYSVNISPNYNRSARGSMMNFGKNPEDMINYHYNQNRSRGGY